MTRTEPIADSNRDARVSRRTFVRRGALAGAAATGLAGAATARPAPSPGTPAPSPRSRDDVPITMAGYALDRVNALVDGRVRVEGCDATFEVAAIGDMNTDALGGPMTREVTEIGLSPYMLAWANDGLRNHALIPIFPIRLFRHKSIFIRPDRGIERPEDLRGRRVATAGYSSTSLTWIRGILQDEHGVRPEDVRWFVSAKDSAADTSGRISRNEQVVPDGLSITSGPAGKDESQMLVDGDVDALFHAAEPMAFRRGDPNCVRLFTDSRAAERAYFEKTGIFPIMHAVAVRRDAIERHPWLPLAVFNAYCEAKRAALDDVRTMGWITSMLPWFGQELEATTALMGEDHWPYGIERNRTALEALFRYSHEQGLCNRRLTIEELFHASVLDAADPTLS